MPWVIVGAVVIVAGLVGACVYLYRKLADAQSQARIASAELVITKALNREHLDIVMTASEAKAKSAADALANAAQQAINADAKIKAEDAVGLDAELAARGFK